MRKKYKECISLEIHTLAVLQQTLRRHDVNRNEHVGKKNLYSKRNKVLKEYYMMSQMLYAGVM